MRSPLLRFFDRRDEKKACAWRQSLGREGWIVSWQRVDESSAQARPWLARVSCRECPQTFERQATSRSRAILEAVTALEDIVGPCGSIITGTSQPPDDSA